MIPLDSIRKFAKETPDQAAVVTQQSVLSWKDFQRQTEATLDFLLQNFDTSLVTQAFYIVQNRVEVIPWLAACATLGIPMTGIDYTLDEQTIVRLIDSIGADFVVCAGRLFPEAAQHHCHGVRFFDIDALEMPLASLDTAEINDRIQAGRSETRPFRAISFTSGTSGPPKSVIRTKSFDRRRFDYFVSRYHFTADDRFLLSMPLYHAAGNGWARMFLGLGATIYMTSIESPAAIATALVNQGITATVMHPNLLRTVLDALDALNPSGKLALRWLLVGGKNLPPSLKDKALNQLGDVIYEYYGTTETGVNTLAEPADLRLAPASSGIPIEGNAIVIVDPEGNELPKRTVGSVVISSYMNMHSYGDMSANELFINDVRYLQTPDHGYLDEDSRLYLVNRTGSDRELYYVYRLEEHIRNLPGVNDVFLLQHGSSTKLDCVLDMHNAEDIKARMLDEIRCLARDQMIELDNIHLVDRIPYSPSGKVRVQELKRMVDAEQVV